MVNLTLTEKGGEAKQLTFDKDEITIGRVQGNDVVLAKGNVSKRHCRIFTQAGKFSVEDLKSTNGTYINGRKIGETTLISNADKVYIGDFIVKVSNAPGAEAVPVAPASPEAGSLSSAVVRKAPPPPPAPRAAASPSRADEPAPRAKSGATLPPPPPPPKRDRPTMKPAEAPPEPAPPEMDLAPPMPDDIDLDEESQPVAPPKLSIPPLKPVKAAPAAAPPAEVDSSSEEEEAITGHRDKQPLTAPTWVPRDGSNWLNQLLEANGVSKVFIGGAHSVEVERGGRRETVPGAPEVSALVDIVRSLANSGTPRPAPDASLVDVVIGDTHLTAIFPPAADHLCAKIQKAAPVKSSLVELVADGGASKEIQQLLESCTAHRCRILVGGDERARRVVVQALAASFPSRYHVIALGEGISGPMGAGAWTKLLPVPNAPNLVAAAAVLQPDYLVVDVTSAAMAADVVAACTMSERGGFVAYLPGRSPADALARLHAMANSSAEALGGSPDLLASAIDVVVVGATLDDGSVRIIEVAEPKVQGDGRLSAEPLIQWKANRFTATGRPSGLAGKLAAAKSSRS